MKRGRKPLPNAVKRQKGTDQACRMNADTLEFPVPEREDGQPPSWMTNADALEMWDKMYPLLMANKVLTIADLYALAQLCRIEGEIAQKARAGVDISVGLNTSIRQFYEVFGMTPSSRARVSPGSGAKDNKFSGRGKEKVS